VNVVAPVFVGGTLLPSTKVTSTLLPIGLYCPDIGTVPPVFTVVDFILKPPFTSIFYINSKSVASLIYTLLKTKHDGSIDNLQNEKYNQFGFTCTNQVAMFPLEALPNMQDLVEPSTLLL
jgi:hypothetical protein